ncbi:hypothetical protein IWZ01DRAFT_488110 [Phyllosticta capitalensis]
MHRTRRVLLNLSTRPKVLCSLFMILPLIAAPGCIEPSHNLPPLLFQRCKCPCRCRRPQAPAFVPRQTRTQIFGRWLSSGKSLLPSSCWKGNCSVQCSKTPCCCRRATRPHSKSGGLNTKRRAARATRSTKRQFVKITTRTSGPRSPP